LLLEHYLHSVSFKLGIDELYFYLKTTFLHKIREEEKFDSLEALTAAIAADEKIHASSFKNNTTV